MSKKISKGMSIGVALCAVLILLLTIILTESQKVEIDTPAVKPVMEDVIEPVVVKKLPKITEPIIHVLTASNTEVQPLEDVAYELSYTTESGDVQSYLFEMSQRSDWNNASLLTESAKKKSSVSGMNKGNESTLHIVAKGVFNIKMYASSKKHSWNVAAVYTDFDYRSEDVSRYQKAFSQAFTFKLHRKGYISDLNTTNGLPMTAHSFIKQFLYSIQSVLPKENEGKWVTREIDNAGQYRARYQLQNAKTSGNNLSIKKEKEAYLRKIVKEETYSPFKTSESKIKNSVQKIVLKKPVNWVHNISFSEKLEYLSERKVWAKSYVSLEVKHNGFNSTVVFPSSFEEFKKRLYSEEFLMSRYYETNPYLNALGKGLNAEESIDKFIDMLSYNGSLADAFIVNYLRQYPEKAEQFSLMLDRLSKGDLNGRYTDAMRLRLWSLLVKAGHKEAQDAVMNSVEDSSKHAYTRSIALGSLHDVEYTLPFLPDRLMSLHHSIQNPVTPLEQEMKTMTLYAMGSLGDKDNLNLKLKKKIAEQLSGYLSQATESQDQITVLESMANHGGEELLESIKTVFTHKNPLIRAAGFKVFRRMESEKAQKKLTEHYEKEKDETIKAVAMHVLSKTPATDYSMGYATKEVEKTNNLGSVIHLVDYLGSHLKKFPENTDTLEGVLNRPIPARVKREVYKYIEPK